MFPRFSRLIIEDRAWGDPAVSRVVEGLGELDVIVTDDPGRYLEPGALLLKYHLGSFVKDFPVTPGAPPCGEKYVAALQGCLYDCSYCYLRSYLSHNSLTMLVNTPKMKSDVREAVGAGTVRLTTGELSDSLSLDHITGLTAEILPILEGTQATLEARTKSANVGHLLGLDTKNLMITWTLAPENATAAEEPGAASLDERIEAISKVSEAGFRFALRLDPVIPAYWDEEAYRGLLERVRGAAGTPARIEIGLLRFPPGLIDSVRRDIPFSPILRGEYVRDLEGKMRLYRPMRIGIYRALAAMIGDLFPDTVLEISQEDVTVWEDAGITPPGIC
jgi:spore photoproduct lyase